MENKKMLYQQRTLNFDAPAHAEVRHVAEKTTERIAADQGGKPPPLVRPDRPLTDAGVESREDRDPAPAAVARPYTFADFQKFYAGRAQGPMTFAVYQAEFQRLWDAQDSVKTELVARFKARELAKLAARFGAGDAQRSTKQENAAGIVRRMLTSFVLDGTVSYALFSGETFESAVQQKVQALTAGEYYRHFEKLQEAALAKEAALADPQNLADFRLLIEVQGEDALSDQQLARYDTLRADLQRDLRTSQQEITTVRRFQASELQGVSFVRKEGFHDKRGCPLFIVQLESRVTREAFQELHGKAKQLGGWYSSFKKSDAGFQFLDHSQADRFCELLTGDVDRSDVLEARQERKEQSAAQSLHELANDLFLRAAETIERSNESLQNTARRADIQAGVRGRAYADQAMSRTLHSLARALAQGEAKYLDGIRHKTQLETLETVLHLAKWARVRAVKRQANESTYGHGLRQDRVEDEPMGLSTIRWVEFPYPTVYRRHLEEAIQKGRLTKGLKKAAETLHKYVGDTAGDYVEFSRQYELDALLDFLARAKAHAVDVEWMARACENYQRLARAKITNLPELRAALREYLAHRAERRGDDPVKVAERELLGKDLPGFFPTPRPVIERMLELAAIEPQHRVLEPSCGKGDILDALKELHPELSVHAIERNLTLSDVLAAKGYAVQFCDFLAHDGVYDRIVMNPPFDDELAHVRHAYALLAPGGRLVSVMSEGPFFRSDGKASEFLEWLDEVNGQTERLPENAFGGRDAFRQTGVRARLLLIAKPS